MLGLLSMHCGQSAAVDRLGLVSLFPNGSLCSEGKQSPTSQGMVWATPAATSSASRLVCTKMIDLPAAAPCTVSTSTSTLRRMSFSTWTARALATGEPSASDGVQWVCGIGRFTSHETALCCDTLALGQH